MTENGTVHKIERLVEFLNDVKRFSSLWASLLRNVFLALLGSVLILFAYDAIAYLNFETFNPQLFSIPVSGATQGEGTYITFVVPLLIIMLIVWIVSRLVRNSAFEEAERIDYDPEREGVTAILRIFGEYDIDDILRDIRNTKLFHLTRLIGKTVFYWVVFSAMLFAGFYLLFLAGGPYLPWWAPMILGMLLSLLMLRKRYGVELGGIWQMEYLMWDLRWLYNEFKDSGFQA